MPSVKNKSNKLQPTTIIFLSFIAVILVGAFLLVMPFSSAERVFTHPVDALFTAASATCVTGLVVADTGSYWSIFGQIVILVMIQIGGLGLVTVTSFFSFALRKKHELRSMQVASESVNTSGFNDVKSIVRSVIRITFICEFAGALALMGAFVPKYGVKGIYISAYLAVTAFCNAGFDVMGMVEEPFSSLTTMSADPIVMIVIPLLIIAGGLGFYVWMEIVGYRQRRRLSLQSKLILMVTAALIVTGMLFTLILEWNNPATLGGRSIIYKIANGFFNSVTLRTAGFNTIDTANMTPLMKIVSICYMFIGVAPGSTGGGVKITSFAVIIMTIVSVLRSKPDTIIMGRKIEKDMVYKSLTIIFIFIMLILAASITICYATDGAEGLDTAFEVTSAISTTGLSTGVTGLCGKGSLLLLSLIMLIGRVGPITFAIAFSTGKGKSSRNEVYPEGKLMIG